MTFYVYFYAIGTFIQRGCITLIKSFLFQKYVVLLSFLFFKNMETYYGFHKIIKQLIKTISNIY